MVYAGGVLVINYAPKIITKLPRLCRLIQAAAAKPWFQGSIKVTRRGLNQIDLYIQDLQYLVQASGPRLLVQGPSKEVRGWALDQLKREICYGGVYTAWRQREDIGNGVRTVGAWIDNLARIGAEPGWQEKVRAR